MNTAASDGTKQHPHEDHNHMPSASSMQIEIRTLGGQILMTVTADPSWRYRDVLAVLRETGALRLDAGAQIFHGQKKLTDWNNLADIDVSNG